MYIFIDVPKEVIPPETSINKYMDGKSSGGMVLWRAGFLSRARPTKKPAIEVVSERYHVPNRANEIILYLHNIVSSIQWFNFTDASSFARATH